jgi:hypothetical protein
VFQFTVQGKLGEEYRNIFNVVRIIDLLLLLHPLKGVFKAEIVNDLHQNDYGTGTPGRIGHSSS